MLTSDSRFHRLKSQLAVVHGVGGVTAEAGFGFALRELPSHRFVQRMGRDSLVADRSIETTNGRIVAHQTFIKFAVALQHPCLPTRAEAPQNGKRNCARTIGDAICSFVANGFDIVGLIALVYG